MMHGLFPENTAETDAAALQEILAPTGMVDFAVEGYAFGCLYHDLESGLRAWTWRHVCDGPISSLVGLLEFGKLDLIAKSHTGLPLQYPGLD